MPQTAPSGNLLPDGYHLMEYRIDRVLGRGGFGVTYQATDENLDHPVAIKEYFPSGIARRDGATVTPFASRNPTRDEETGRLFAWGQKRFLDEAKVLARFHHPNVVRVLRFFEANGTAYLVMDFEHGGDFVHYRSQMTENPSEAELLAILLPLLDGLSNVHRAGFLHRDIKPSNIIIGSDHKPTLIDFGSARLAMGSENRTLTVIVTPGYAPIEQYDGDGNQGPWTDIYALGAVIYWAIVGAKPPDAISRLRYDVHQPLLDHPPPGYSEGFLSAIDWAMKFDAKSRPQSIAHWQAALGGIAVHAPAPALVHAPVRAPSPVMAPARIDSVAPPRPASTLVPPPARAAPPSSGLGDPHAEITFDESAPLPPLEARSSPPFPPCAPIPHHRYSRRLLELSFGEQFQRIAATAEPFRIGRSRDCDLIVNVPVASRHHAIITWSDGAVQITDCSRHGTYVRYRGGRSIRLTSTTLRLLEEGEIGIGSDPDHNQGAIICFRLLKIAADDQTVVDGAI